MPEYIPARELCKAVGLKYRSARILAERVDLKTLTTPSGQTLYHKQSLHDYINANTNVPEAPQPKEPISIVYCRVSSKKQGDDLDRQVQLARATYPNHTIISDIGS